MTESITKYDEKTNTVHVSILKPFYTVGKILGWKSKVGYGFTPDVIRLVLRNKALLCCYLIEHDEKSYTSWLQVKEFIANNENQGENNGRPIVYLPQELFNWEVPEIGSEVQEELF